MSVQPAAQYDLTFCKTEFKQMQDESIKKLIFSEDLPRVKYLKSPAFDASLWNELVRLGATRHHQLLINETLTPGTIWIEKGMSGPVLNWSEEGMIHRALIEDEHVLILTYSIVDKKATVTKTTLSPFKFGELLHSYLRDTEEMDAIPTSWVKFKKTLELMPISCRVTSAARAQFKRLEKLAEGKDLAVSIIFREKKERVVIEISKHFLLNLNSSKGYVGPTFRSFEACKQIENSAVNSLRIMDFERAVYPGPGTALSELTPSLHIRIKDHKEEHPFHKALTEKNKQEYKFRLWIDFKEGKWELESETII